jgi:ubiquinol-cytochrome c reductase cytochrome b subunit
MLGGKQLLASQHMIECLATVITNLLSAIPWIGQDFVQFVWGGFSVSNATLNRFFSLHYLLPFVLAALVAMHLLTLHEHGSSNPLGVSANTDRLPFHPYFIFKDLVTIFVFLLALSTFVFYMPNVIGHSDNYIPANPMQTPPSIVPEWYLLPYYAILRSIPNKLLGVIAMFSSLLILLAMPLLDTSRIRGSQFRPLMRLSFWTFVVCFFILMFIGSQHVESPYVEIGAAATAFYFGWFIVVVPVIGVVENTLMDISQDSQKTVKNLYVKIQHNPLL